MVITTIILILIGMFFFGRTSGLTSTKTQIEALHKENEALLDKNDSLKNENGKIDLALAEINEKLSNINKLNNRKNEISNYVNTLSANSTADALSKYLNERPKSQSGIK
jgi:predicted nuclease with TOPRIM domain